MPKETNSDNGDNYEHPVLFRQPASAGGDQWHSFSISGNGNQISVYLDGTLTPDYIDQNDPYLSGGAAFETLDDTDPYLMVDDVVLKGTAQQNDQSGPSWVFTGGPRGGIGYDIRIHPQDENIIWVTDAYAGAHQSLDGGQSWKAKNQGINARSGFSGEAIPIFSLTVDPITQILYGPGPRECAGYTKAWMAVKPGVRRIMGSGSNPIWSYEVSRSTH